MMQRCRQTSMPWSLPPAPWRWTQRSTVRHDRGDVIIEAGSVKFGVEFRELASDRGVAIHVLGDAAGEEVELLTFDCFENAPHYHYGPMAKNQRLYLDVTTAPDSLRWALDLFKGGKLAAMLDRAGYSDHAARLNPAMVAQKGGGAGVRGPEVRRRKRPLEPISAPRPGEVSTS